MANVVLVVVYAPLAKMSREGRENKRLRIRQEHLTKAIEEADSVLSSLISDITDTIKHYKKEGWKTNAKHQEWLDKIEWLNERITARKKQFKNDILETVDCYALEEFNNDSS